MRERSRHRSIWNTGEETDHLPVNSRNRFALDESYKGGRHEVFEGKELNGGKRYSDIISPRKIDVEPRFYNRTRGYDHDRRNAQRYPVRGRSRSRSRSRSMSQRNTSKRMRGDSPVRARSRSRSRSWGNTQDSLKGDSPIRYQRHSSHTWTDKRSAHDKSSQPCRNFSLGKCNRGSQCWFSHSSDKISRRDGFSMEYDDDSAETWRHRADHSRVNRQDYDRSFGLVSRGDDLLSESYRSTSCRRDVPCKDYLRGKCRWGDSCRFSHHIESDDFGRGNKNENFDRVNELQSWRPHHKSFSAAMSDRENNKFSHTEQSLSDREGFLNDDKRNTHDLRKWDGPSWDNVDKVSEPVRISGWGETTHTNWNGRDESNIGEKDDGKWGHTLCNERKSWEIPYSSDGALNVEKQPHSRSNETISANDMANEEQHLLGSSQFPNQKGPANAYEYNALQGSQSVSEVPHQPRRLVINLTNPTVSKVDVSDHYLNRSGGNVSSEPGSILNGCYTEQTSFSFDKSSNGANTQQSWVPLELQSQKEDQLAGILEPKSPQILTDSLPGESQTARVTKYPLTSADQVETLSSMEKIHSFTDTKGSLTVLNMDSQLYSLPPSLDLSSSTRNVADNIDHIDPRTKLDLELNSPTPLVRDTSIMNLQGSPKLRQEAKVVVANSEVPQDSSVIGKETKDAKILENRGKIEEGGAAEKDDKGMKMFKNALIVFVKDILKPMWKEGRMSRDAHKTVVKKVVDKVSSSIQAGHVPKTQDKIEHYLSSSKSKITKLAQAYVERCHKAETTGVTK